MNTDNKLYCSVHIYDYEHSGDCRVAYSILERYSIFKTNFECNGDGNVAFITFSMDYNKSILNRLLNDLDNNGYGLSCANLYEFESKFELPNLLPKIEYKDFWCLYNEGAGYYELLEGNLDNVSNKVVIVEWHGYISEIERNSEKMYRAIDAMKKLGCNKWITSRNDIELHIIGITTIGNCCNVINQEFFENNKHLLYSFCNKNATRYGERSYGISYWKRDYPKLMERLFNIK